MILDKKKRSNSDRTTDTGTKGLIFKNHDIDMS